jgi:hypothetical protein
LYCTHFISPLNFLSAASAAQYSLAKNAQIFPLRPAHGSRDAYFS